MNIISNIKTLCKIINETFTKELSYLIPKTSNFYWLPVIFKSEEIWEAVEKRIWIQWYSNSSELQFRPIVTSQSSPTIRLIDIKTEFIRSWKIYIDDSFLLQHKTLQTLRIKFTTELNFKELLSLDILIENYNLYVTTDIYHKVIDTEKYVHFNSHRT